MTLKTKTFRRWIIVRIEDADPKFDELVTEVNNFIAGFSVGNVLDVRYDLFPLDTSSPNGSYVRVMYMGTVFYLE